MTTLAAGRTALTALNHNSPSKMGFHNDALQDYPNITGAEILPIITITVVLYFVGKFTSPAFHPWISSCVSHACEITWKGFKGVNRTFIMVL